MRKAADRTISPLNSQRSRRKEVFELVFCSALSIVGKTKKADIKVAVDNKVGNGLEAKRTNS